MRARRLERKLLWGVVAIFVIPTALAEGILIVLYRRGVFQDAWGLLLAVLIGLAAMMAYLSWIAYAVGRPVIRTVRMIQDGTELMTTVNPDHRIEVRTGNELEALAEDVNQLADHLRDAKGGLDFRVAEATRELRGGGETLAAILEALADGVVVATLDGRITLANPVASGSWILTDCSSAAACSTSSISHEESPPWMSSGLAAGVPCALSSRPRTATSFMRP